MKNIFSFLKKLSILDTINLFILFVVVIIYFITFTATPYRLNLAFIYFVFFLFLWLTVYLRNINMDQKWKALLMFIMPIVFLFSVFESFFMLLPYFNGLRYDALLEKIDYILLGFSPTVWIEKWSTPLITDLMYLFYFFYFPMPIFILGWMLAKKKYIEIEKAMFTFLICYYGAYIIYFFMPVQGPRFFLQNEYSHSLDGYFLSQPIHALIDALEPNKLDAFPSLHTAILLVTMMVSYQNNRKIFYGFIPLAFGIIISLVYCRYHYFIDILAGLLWAIISIILANQIYKKYFPSFTNHFGRG